MSLCSGCFLWQGGGAGGPSRQVGRTHGNSGYRVKNLHHTSGCTHDGYPRQWAASLTTQTKCAVHECAKAANRACHVVAANQNGLKPGRSLVYMCATHNAIYGTPLDIRLNALTIKLPNCTCGHL